MKRLLEEEIKDGIEISMLIITLPRDDRNFIRGYLHGMNDKAKTDRLLKGGRECQK